MWTWKKSEEETERTDERGTGSIACTRAHRSLIIPNANFTLLVPRVSRGISSGCQGPANFDYQPGVRRVRKTSRTPNGFCLRSLFRACVYARGEWNRIPLRPMKVSAASLLITRDKLVTV